jgi:hypothetical protein
VTRWPQPFPARYAVCAALLIRHYFQGTIYEARFSLTGPASMDQVSPT